MKSLLRLSPILFAVSSLSLAGILLLSEPLPETRTDLMSALARQQSISNKISYLSVVLSATNSMDAKVKDEAVDQLAALQTAEALDVLAAHITYVSVQQGFKTPLVKSRFIEMGEKSVPTLLRVIDSSSDPKVLSMAVPALVLIKGTNYHRFCWEIADKFPASVLQKLNHYAVVE